MATVLVQTENRPKTTNDAHVVSNFHAEEVHCNAISRKK